MAAFASLNLACELMLVRLSYLAKREIFPMSLIFIPFFFFVEQNRTNHVDFVRLSSLIELTSLSSINRSHRKVPARLCSINEPIEQQSDQLCSIDF